MTGDLWQLCMLRPSCSATGFYRWCNVFLLHLNHLWLLLVNLQQQLDSLSIIRDGTFRCSLASTYFWIWFLTKSNLVISKECKIKEEKKCCWHFAVGIVSSNMKWSNCKLNSKTANYMQWGKLLVLIYLISSKSKSSWEEKEDRNVWTMLQLRDKYKKEKKKKDSNIFK